MCLPQIPPHRPAEAELPRHVRLERASCPRDPAMFFRASWSAITGRVHDATAFCNGVHVPTRNMSSILDPIRLLARYSGAMGWRRRRRSSLLQRYAITLAIYAHNPIIVSRKQIN